MRAKVVRKIEKVTGFRPLPQEGLKGKDRLKRADSHTEVSGSSYRLGDSVLEFYTQKTNSPPSSLPGQTGEMLGQVNMLESLDSTHEDVSLPQAGLP